ncbi:CU044_5270 family protein [Streptomyces sp. NPDC018711]|uniref:CU044_5270 family protein n=1 Tax=Streptomyces sp. NPDC018711 TaxID=3365052 RepID=UPI0037B253D4
MIRMFGKRTEPLDRTELARLLPAPSTPAMPSGRQSQLEEHLLSEIRTPAPAPEAPARPVRRALLIGVPVTAAVLTAALAVGMLTGGGTDAPPTAASPVEAPVVRIEEGSTVQLASTVQRIAAAASAQRIPEPKPGQYVYIKSKVSFLTSMFNGDTNESRTWVQPLHQREVWKSPDGREGWLDEPGYQPAGGITLDLDGGQEALPYLTYDWVRKQPADPDRLLAAIRATATDGGSHDRDQQTFEAIEEIINEQLVPAPTAAALYRAAAKIPGVSVVSHSQDAAGRTGLALARLDEQSGERTELIFDRKTFVYLGSRGVQVKPSGDVAPGTVVERTAVLERAVVDARKERPGRSGTGTA